MSPRDETDILVDRPLSRGSHQRPEDGACVMEWLRLHEGKDFNDQRLPCQCPVLHRALVRFNDRMPDGPRQALKVIALKSLGTANDGHQQWRMFRLADVACREWAPAALRAYGRAESAAGLEALKPITDRETALAARDACRAAYVVVVVAAAVVAAADVIVAAADAADAAAYVIVAVAYAAVAAADAADAAYAVAVAAADAAVWRRATEVLEELVSDVA